MQFRLGPYAICGECAQSRLLRCGALAATQKAPDDIDAHAAVASVAPPGFREATASLVTRGVADGFAQWIRFFLGLHNQFPLLGARRGKPLLGCARMVAAARLGGRAQAG